MNNHSQPVPGQVTDQTGLTYVELLIAAAIFGILVIFIGNFLIDSVANNLRVEAMSDLGNLSQSAINRIKADVSQSKRFFDSSERNRSYWRNVQWPKDISPLDFSRLPLIVDQGSFAPTRAADFQKPFVQSSVGNILFFAQVKPAMEFLDYKRLIDLYRFVAYFIIDKTDAHLDPGISHYYQLMRCESDSVADLHQVREIEDGEIRGRILDLLRQSGVESLWETEQPHEVAFSGVSNYFPGVDPLPGFRIAMKHCDFAVDGLGKRDRQAGSLTYSVAFNKTSQFAINRPVPLLALVNPAQPLFPGGFEVAAVGPKSGRQVFLRLVLATSIKRQILSREATVIATIRD